MLELKPTIFYGQYTPWTFTPPLWRIAEWGGKDKKCKTFCRKADIAEFFQRQMLFERDDQCLRYFVNN